MLILNKCDLVGEEELAELEGVLRTLQPRAKFIRTSKGEVDPKEILNTSLVRLRRGKSIGGLD